MTIENIRIELTRMGIIPGTEDGADMFSAVVNNPSTGKAFPSVCAVYAPKAEYPYFHVVARKKQLTFIPANNRLVQILNALNQISDLGAFQYDQMRKTIYYDISIPCGLEDVITEETLRHYLIGPVLYLSCAHDLIYDFAVGKIDNLQEAADRFVVAMNSIAQTQRTPEEG